MTLCLARSRSGRERLGGNLGRKVVRAIAKADMQTVWQAMSLGRFPLPRQELFAHLHPVENERKAPHQDGTSDLVVNIEINNRVTVANASMVMVRNPGSQRVNSMIVRVIADFGYKQEIVVLELGDVGIVIHEHAL